MGSLDESGRLVCAPSPRWVESAKWVRAFLAGKAVVDSKRACLLREGGPPKYYFPREDVRTSLLWHSERKTSFPDKGEATWWTIRVNGKTAENAAWSFPAPAPEASFLKGYISFEWDAMDAWFEEKEEVFVHPRDPFKRIDVLQSSRAVRVVAGGETVAETNEPSLLFEPGHPIRYYLPKADVRLDLLVPSDTRTSCPYKGDARYYSVVGPRPVKDVAWSYSYPTRECAPIAGRVCFFNERVDALYIDGAPVPRPKTKWA
ncbi:MAG TPA: DUF427 domain-containing protein [Candidatus Binatia bacterium]